MAAANSKRDKEAATRLREKEERAKEEAERREKLLVAMAEADRATSDAKKGFK